MPVLRDQLAQFVAGAGGDDAAAGIDHRPLGPPDQRRPTAAICPALARRSLDVIAGQVHGHVVVGHGLGKLHVLGQVDQHRAGPARGGDVKRLAHDAGHVVHVGHQVMVLGDAAADLDDGRFLEGVGADDAGAHLAGDGQQGNAVQLGVGDGGHQVGGPRAAGGHADADLARCCGRSPGRRTRPPARAAAGSTRILSRKRVNAWCSGMLAPPG